MNAVINRAKLIKTTLGGVCCVPIALLSNENTMIIRVKDVTTTRIAGANDNTVISIRSWTICPDKAKSSPKSSESSCALAEKPKLNVRIAVRSQAARRMFVFLILCRFNLTLINTDVL